MGIFPVRKSNIDGVKIIYGIMNGVMFRICCANFLLVAAVMVQLASIMYVGRADGVSMRPVSFAVAAFSLGLYAPGPFCSYIVARYQRKSVYMISLLLLVAISGIMCFSRDIVSIASIRFLEGAVCGLAQVSLGSTLLNDLTVSERRTLSDYYFAWSAIFAMPVGVAAAYWAVPVFGFNAVLLASMLMLLFSMLSVMRINVPFRAPINVKLFSCDRFWQKNDLLPFINLLLLSTTFGMFVAANHRPMMFLFAALGVLGAYPLRKMVFTDADVRAEIVTGMILVLAALLIPFATSSPASLHAAALLFGAGIGLSSSRFLLYFLKMTGHCQRGTAQNTYMLSRECGYAAGFVSAFFVPHPAVIAIPMALVSIFFYLAVTHPWFLKHKDRYFKFREV